MIGGRLSRSGVRSPRVSKGSLGRVALPDGRASDTLWLRQGLRQNSGDQFVQTNIGSGVSKLVEFRQSGRPLGLGVLMLRIVAGQRHRAGVRIDNLVEHLVDVFQGGLAFRALCLVAVAFAVVL